MNIVRLSALAALFSIAFALPPHAFANHSPSEGEGAYAEEAEAHEDEEHEVQGATHRTVSSLGLGSVGEEVKTLQAELIAAGLLGITAPTGYYGPLTAAAVEKRAAMSAHGHEPLDISSWAKTPRVGITMHEDAFGGYNLEVHAANYRFAPEHVNGPVRKNEGHAHLYVNGAKIARLYGSWYNLPASVLRPGENEIRVTLNANDHSELADDGEIVEDRVTVMVSK